MQTISIAILTCNSAHEIEAAISSVLWADEIVVADTDSTDRTVEIAKSLGARVVPVPFQGFGDLRNRAADACRCDWVFSLDSDERCTPAVRDEILVLLAGEAKHDAYMVPRRNFMMGRWIRGSGWYPNYRQIQLFRRGLLRYTPDPIHEHYELSSTRPVGKLQNAIWHFPVRDFEQIISKANRYSTLGALRLSSRRVTMWSAFGHGLWAFLKHYVFKLGFRDGWAGFVIALGNFEGTFYRYAKRYEAIQGWQPPAQEPIRRPSASPSPVSSP